jgi:hypothetical protein
MFFTFFKRRKKTAEAPDSKATAINAVAPQPPQLFNGQHERLNVLSRLAASGEAPKLGFSLCVVFLRQ